MSFVYFGASCNSVFHSAFNTSSIWFTMSCAEHSLNSFRYGILCKRLSDDECSFILFKHPLSFLKWWNTCTRKSENVIEKQTDKPKTLFDHSFLSFAIGGRDWLTGSWSKISRIVYTVVEHFLHNCVAFIVATQTAFVADLLAYYVEIIDVFFLPQSFSHLSADIACLRRIWDCWEAFIGSLHPTFMKRFTRDESRAHFILKIPWTFEPDPRTLGRRL